MSPTFSKQEPDEVPLSIDEGIKRERRGMLQSQHSAPAAIPIFRRRLHCLPLENFASVLVGHRLPLTPPFPPPFSLTSLLQPFYAFNNRHSGKR